MTIDSGRSFIFFLNRVSLPLVDNDLRQSILIALLLTKCDEREDIDRKRAAAAYKFVTLTAVVTYAGIISQYLNSVFFISSLVVDVVAVVTVDASSLVFK
jgi:hypothetical protein